MLWNGVHALVDRAKAGDEQAWEQLHALAQPYLLQCVQRRVGLHGADQSVSDYVQQSWLRAWQSMPQFQGGKDDAQTGALFRAWLGKIVRTVSSNQHRYARQLVRCPPAPLLSLDANRPGDSSERAVLEPAASGSTISTALRREEVRAQVRVALEGLDPRDRQIIELRTFEGCSFPEIGRRLGLDESTVRERFHRIVEGLGHRLKAL